MAQKRTDQRKAAATARLPKPSPIQLTEAPRTKCAICGAPDEVRQIVAEWAATPSEAGGQRRISAEKLGHLLGEHYGQPYSEWAVRRHARHCVGGGR